MNVRMSLSVILLAALAVTCPAEDRTVNVTDILNSNAADKECRKELAGAVRIAIKANDAAGIREALTTPGVKRIDLLSSVLREERDPALTNLYVQLLSTKPALDANAAFSIAEELAKRTKECRSEALLARVKESETPDNVIIAIARAFVVSQRQAVEEKAIVWSRAILTGAPSEQDEDIHSNLLHLLGDLNTAKCDGIVLDYLSMIWREREEPTPAPVFDAIDILAQHKVNGSYGLLKSIATHVSDAETMTLQIQAVKALVAVSKIEQSADVLNVVRATREKAKAIPANDRYLGQLVSQLEQRVPTTRPVTTSSVSN